MSSVLPSGSKVDSEYIPLAKAIEEPILVQVNHGKIGVQTEDSNGTILVIGYDGKEMDLPEADVKPLNLMPDVVFDKVMINAVIAVFIVYFVAPVQLLVSIHLSTCHGGSSLPSQLLTAASLAVVFWADESIRQLILGLQALNEDIGLFWTDVVKETFKVGPIFGKTVHWFLWSSTHQLLVVIAEGKLAAADFQTDLGQPGQVKACERRHSFFADLYSKSWQIPIIGQWMDSVQLSDLYALALAMVFFMQGVYLAYKVYYLVRGRNLTTSSNVLQALGATASAKLLMQAAAQEAVLAAEIEAATAKGSKGSRCQRLASVVAVDQPASMPYTLR